MQLRAARALACAAWTACWAAAAVVPPPGTYFGHRMGEDRTVLDWSGVVSYFRALDEASDRVQVIEYGKSTEGRPMIAAFVAAPDTLKNLERYREIQERLADPRKTPDPEPLIAAGKTVVMITCSIHATEIGATPAAIEFAYKLATGNDEETLGILANTILILVPSLNPDGLDMVASWYRRTLGTGFEGTAPPELYQKYVGHDNNRDWYMFTQAETRATVAELHNRWHPQIVYDVHQQGTRASRFFVPPWIDPIEPNVDPIIMAESNMIGAGIAADLTAAGKTGVVINAMYDFWTPARAYQAYHGGIRILSEAASAKLATPVTVEASDIADRGTGYDPRERSWNYLEPWMGGEWHLRDIVDYDIAAMESVMRQAATRRAGLLRGFYNVGKRAVERTSPWGFLVPFDQRDAGAARRMLETLAFGRVEIERGERGYVIRMQQPYSAFAKTLLERQHYPDLREYPGGPPKRPYDVTAHTLPLLMGVRVETLNAPATGLEPAAAYEFRGPADGDTSLWTKRHRAGRVGVYQGWAPSIDEGWTRWVLEDFGIPYQQVRSAGVIAGNLRAGFDSILFADQSARRIAFGYPKGTMPDEYTGGLGEEGPKALRKFAEDGGTLVFLNRACEYAVKEFGLKVKDVAEELRRDQLYMPGSLLNARVNTDHPLAAGTPAEIAIWAEESPVWDVPEGSPARVLVRYPDSHVLASGWLLGEQYIAGKAAAIEYPLGKGRVVLFGMRPQYRGQSWQTYKMLFNCLAQPGNR